MANTKWSIPHVIAITKWSIQGSGRRCKPRASNGAMTAARNSQVFLRSGLFNGIQRQALAVQAFRAPVPDVAGFRGLPASQGILWPRAGRPASAGRSARPASQSSELSKKGKSSKRPGPFGLGATGQGLEWSAGADDRRVPRSLVPSVPRLRMLDEHHFRSLGKLVVGNLDRIAGIDNVGN